MAEHLDRTQLSELSAFVNALAKLGGYTTDAQWARESGVPRPNLGNARNGKKGISGYNLLRMINAAARRADIDPAAISVAAAEGAREASARENADRLERRLEEVSDLAAENFQILRDQLADVARRLPAAAAPDHKAVQAPK